MKKTAPLLILASMAFAPAAFSAPAGTLSVHVLDQQTGMPPSDVTVTLEKQQQDKWIPVASGKTDHDGRIKSLYPQDQRETAHSTSAEAVRLFNLQGQLKPVDFKRQ